MIEQKQKISFLLGAGFSKPYDNYPIARDINEKFRNFKASDITIDSEKSAWFNEGIIGPNNHHYKQDAKMIEEIISFYRDDIVEREDFHYEDFFDWYKKVQFGKIKYKVIDNIADKEKSSVYDLMIFFDIIFNQLLKNLLTKNLPVKHIPITHRNFYYLINKLSQNFTIQIHTLNHDIFIESLTFDKLTSDGFIEAGSPYYGELIQSVRINEIEGLREYTVKLPYFVNKFDAPINIYKLHGSLNHYVDQRQSNNTLKALHGISHSHLFKEVNQGNEQNIQLMGGIFNPTFLTGTTFKKSLYNSTRYLTSVFDHFKNNLNSSRVLIVIGYGFGDKKINNTVRTSFYQKEKRKIYVVDVSAPKTSIKTIFVSGGVENFNYCKLYENILKFYPDVVEAIEIERKRLNEFKI